MTLLTLAEVYGAYCLAAFLTAAFVVAVAIHFYGDGPLPGLDGRPLLNGLDDRDRRRHIRDAALVEDREVALLDSVWELPCGVPRA